MSTRLFDVLYVCCIHLEVWIATAIQMSSFYEKIVLNGFIVKDFTFLIQSILFKICNVCIRWHEFKVLNPVQYIWF